MVIDTSALIALLFAEAESRQLLDAVLASERRLLGVPSYVEAAAIMHARRGPGGLVALDALLHELEIMIVPMTREAGRSAVDAYCRFGRGAGSPAGLNYGDCLAYGVATAEGEALLFKGTDFSRTDVPAVQY